MAQTGYTPILIYSSSTVSQAPAAGNLTNSTLGSELAINITDGKLFYKDNANAVQVIGWKTTPTTAGGTGLTSYTAGDLLYYATGTTLSKLAIGANTTVLTSSGTAPQWTAQSSLSVGTAANLLSNATTGVMQIVGPGAGTTRVMTIPNANFTAARTDAAQTFTGDQTINGILNVTYGTGDQLLINAKTNDSTAANNAGIGLRANSSATAGSRFAQLWFDADGGNLSGGDYFLMTKNGNDGTIDLIQYSNSAMRFAANYVGRATIDMTLFPSGGVSIGNTTDPGATNLSVTGTAKAAAFIPTSATVPTNGMYYPASNELAWAVNSTRRLNLFSDGALSNNTSQDQWYTSTNAGFYAAWQSFIAVASSGNVSFVANRLTSDGSAISMRRGGTEVGTISVTATATAYNTSSDYRLKNIEGPLENSGAFIDALQPKIGTWKIDGSRFVGFLAHEVQEVSPSTVTGQKDDTDEDGNPVMQSMEYGSAEFIANIVAELQSLRKRVAQLEAN